MSTKVLIIFALLIIFIPLIIRTIKKIFQEKPKPNVIVECPHCKTAIGLEKERNFICGSCNASVDFNEVEVIQ